MVREIDWARECSVFSMLWHYGSKRWKLLASWRDRWTHMHMHTRALTHTHTQAHRGKLTNTWLWIKYLLYNSYNPLGLNGSESWMQIKRKRNSHREWDSLREDTLTLRERGGRMSRQRVGREAHTSCKLHYIVFLGGIILLLYCITVLFVHNRTLVTRGIPWCIYPL